MALALRNSRLAELVRFYQAAVLNTLFGLSAYAVLVWFGMNIYAAQAVAHVMGMTFNYFTYRGHVFRDSSPAKLRFILSYGINYLASLAVLAGVVHFVASPYFAGIMTALIVSVGNYFALKRIVFRTRPT